MRIIKKKNMSIIICIFSSVFVILKMYTGSNTFLWIFFIVTCAGILLDSAERKVEYLIYFIPWVYTLKFEFTEFSLYVFLAAFYVVISLCCIWLQNCKVNRGLMVSFSFFIVYTITIPLCNGDELTKILGFALNYITIFLAVIFIKDRRIFMRYTQIYALSLVVSCIVRLISFVTPSIGAYLESMTRVNTIVTDGELYVRFAGLDLDPNYFAIQILTTIACLLVIIYYAGSAIKHLIALIITLAIFGMVSLSKMFLIVLSALIIVSLVCFFKRNKRSALKYLYIVLLCSSVGIYFTHDFFYQAFLVRFTGTGISPADVTTGRSVIWLNFLLDIVNNPKILTWGAGYGSGHLNVFTAHNMYLTSLYYMGIIGTTISLIYFVHIRKTIYKNTRINAKENAKLMLFNINYLPLYVIIVANFSLDSIIMDYFPIHLLLALLAFKYNSKIDVKKKLDYKSCLLSISSEKGNLFT